MDDFRDWKDINLRLVNRGRPSTYLKPAMIRQRTDLSAMNRKKVGRPYSFSNMLIISAFAIKSVFKIGYREAAGNVKDFLDLFGVRLCPDFRTIQWRVSKMKSSAIKFQIYQRCGKDLEVVIDSSGIKSVNDGEYRTTKYGKVKTWKKIHIAIDPKTHRILNIVVTGNEIGDPREFVPLIDPIRGMNDVARATADGAYDSEENFKYCDDNSIDPMIPVHINATGREGRHRRKRVAEQLGVIRMRGRNQNRTPELEDKRENQDRWKKSSGYHKRSLVETSFSVFKGAFGEYTFSKNDGMKEKELLLKAVVYNKFLI